MCRPWWNLSADGQPLVLEWSTPRSLFKGGWLTILSKITNDMAALNLYERSLFLMVTCLALLQLQDALEDGKADAMSSKLFAETLEKFGQLAAGVSWIPPCYTKS